MQELAREVGEAPEELGAGDEDLAQNAFAKREIARMVADPDVAEIPATAAEIVLAAELPAPVDYSLPEDLSANI